MNRNKVKISFKNATESFKRLNPDYFGNPRVSSESEQLPKNMSKNSEIIDIKNWPFPINVKDMICCVTCELIPESKARPRFGAHGVYTEKKTRLYEAKIRSMLPCLNDKDSIFGLRCIFYRHNRQRIDVDNLLKAISDSANNQVWDDDSQVHEVFGKLFLDHNSPRVDICIYKIGSKHLKYKCLKCGINFDAFPSGINKFCSQKCHYDYQNTLLKCKNCLTEFKIRNSNNRRKRAFCSSSCCRVYHLDKNNSEL